jgi:hypothetical protein
MNPGNLQLFLSEGLACWFVCYGATLRAISRNKLEESSFRDWERVAYQHLEIVNTTTTPSRVPEDKNFRLQPHISAKPHS